MKPQRLLQKEDWITMPMQDAADTVTRRADAAATAPQAAAVTVPPAAEITQITRADAAAMAADQAAAADATIKLNIFFPADNINAAARMKTPLCGSIFYLMIKYADDISSHYRSCKYRISFFFFLVLMYSLPHLLEHR